MEKYFRLSNCEKFIVFCVNVEIWDKFDNKIKYNDLCVISM